MENNNLLAHYTDANGLLGILKYPQAELWATNIEFLNDHHEYIQVIKNTIHKLDENNQHDQILKFNLGLFQNEPIAYGFEPQRTFVISFSKSNNQLSQWRAYAGENGFCIEFDEQELLEIKSTAPTALERLDYNRLSDFQQPSTPNITRAIIDCRYTSIEFDEKIEEILSQSRNHMESLKNCINTEYIHDIFHLTTHTKHQAFHEENERRLIIRPLNPYCAADLTCFRVRKGILTPYIPFKFPFSAIKRITIGPSSQPALARRGLENLLCKVMHLESADHCGIEIDDSNIPLRF